MVSRRTFIGSLLSSLGLASFGHFFASCDKEQSGASIKGRIAGASSAAGHILRDRKPGIPSEIETMDMVIVGGGISGLSAARTLKNEGVDNFVLLELEDEAGGNSMHGQNKVSAYPWGAHYLPLPDLENKELISFLKEHDVITHFNENGLPYYNEYYLCHDPEERLYIHGRWQNGLIPHLGVSDAGMAENRRFLTEMEERRFMKGSDGKFAFDIPLDHSSADDAFRKLDTLSMHDYLVAAGYKSPHLFWYVNYACRDDYGTDIKNTSAWAGIHYFASRRGKAANAVDSAVLTWPEGNGFLAGKLKKAATDKIRTGCVVYGVDLLDHHIAVDYVEISTGRLKRILANKCIVCTPQFVNKRILRNIPGRRTEDYKQFTYAPWMVANLTVKSMGERLGRPLSWDNVLYDSKSLGYVNATHQHLSQHHPERVFTYYYPLTDGDPVKEREKAFRMNHAGWTEIIVNDLKKIYPSIETSILNLDVWIWGHGMIRPTIGFISSPARKSFQKSGEKKVYFAHSDLSGISIFEEAFYHGVRAAKEALAGI